jgi:DNA ligase-associated metallophosphoesterase
VRAGISAAHSRASGNPASGSPPSRGRAERELTVAGVTLIADPAGALYWPEEKLLVAADLHLEKGSAYAARGVLLPPYDTAATLARLARLIERYAPRLVVALGDSFHDGGGPARMADNSRAALTALQRGRDWVWLAGNHDPDPAGNIGGRFADVLALGGLTFRHEPSVEASAGEIAGHLHPLACIVQRGRALRRRCFASDGRRLVMPAFGSYAGGLNVRHRAIASLFPALAFTAHMLGERRLYAVPAARCLSD